MENLVDILDFDGRYKLQSYYKDLNYSWIDLSNMKNVNCYCEKESLVSIYKTLKKKKKSKVTFIGNGNYHYVTYLLLKEIKTPFTLVLFDHHTDMMDSPAEDLVTCGSWVLRALRKDPYLKKVIIIGVDRELVRPIMKSSYSRVEVLSKEMIGQGLNLKEYLSEHIETKNVYISIDKDVLSPSEVTTNWDQGSMKLSQLSNAVRYLCENKKICGMDVCGEYYGSPCEYFNPQVITAIKRNDEVNKAILEDSKKAYK